MESAINIIEKDDQFRAESIGIATELGIQHKNLLNTIKKYETRIQQEFGLVAFETRPDALGRENTPTKIYWLTEDQALFVGTLSKNTEKVVNFKVNLVKAFSEARKSKITPELTPVQALLQSVQLLAAQEKRLAEVETKLDTVEKQVTTILETQIKAEEEMKLLPISTEPLPEMTMRKKVSELVNAFVISTGTDRQQVWNRIYDRLYYLYHISIKSCHKEKKTDSWLDVAEKKGHLDKMHIIISNMIKNPQLY